MGIAEVKSLPKAFAPAVPDSVVQTSVVDLRGVGQVIWRRRAWVVVPAVTMALLALAATFLLPNKYQASSRLIFDPRNLQVLQNDLRVEGTSGEEAGVQAESQLQIITSTSVLGKVVDRLGLAADPDFGAPSPSLTGRLTDALGKLVGAAPTPADPAALALRQLQADVTVRRTEKTYILEVLVTTPDAAKSARIANAIDDAFLDELVDSRADTTRRSGQAVTSRLDELRSRLARSEGAVEAYRDQHNLLGTGGKPLVEQQMADINSQLMLTRGRVADQEARRADIANLEQHGSSLDAVSESTLSPAITALKSQLTVAQQAEKDALLVYGARHPAMVAASAQVQLVQQRLNAEVARLARTAQSDLDRTRASEKSLSRRLDALKRDNVSANDDLVRLRELERVADSDRVVYETYLNRSKDLQERKTVDTVNARVLSPAVPPTSKGNPSRVLLALGGLFAGAVLGVCGGLVREQFDPTIRSARQVEAETRVPVLARLDERLGLDDPALWSLRDQMAVEGASWPTRIVAVVGVGMRPEGAITIHDLARATASDGNGTLLVDADEDGTLSKLLDCDGQRGLGDLLGIPAAATRDALRRIGAARFLPAGQARPGTPGQNQSLQALLDGLSRDHRLVLVYGGSALKTARTRTLASVVDEILLVVEAGRATLPDLRSALDVLGPESRRLRGILLTGAAEPS